MCIWWFSERNSSLYIDVDKQRHNEKKIRSRTFHCSKKSVLCKVIREERKIYCRRFDALLLKVGQSMDVQKKWKVIDSKRTKRTIISYHSYLSLKKKKAIHELLWTSMSPLWHILLLLILVWLLLFNHNYYNLDYNNRKSMDKNSKWIKNLYIYIVLIDILFNK